MQWIELKSDNGNMVRIPYAEFLERTRKPKAPQPTPYRFDKSKVYFFGASFVNQLACCVAQVKGYPHSIVPSVEEVEREAQAWEPIGRYSGC